MRRRASGLLVSALAVAAGSPARGDNGMARLAEAFVLGAFVTELVIPDVRLVFGADDHRWVLSWPIVFASLKPYRGERVGIGLHPFAEPQYQPTREAVRLGGGVRATLFDREAEVQASPLVEVGGLLGQDGSGWFAGGGLAVGIPEVGVTFGLVVRAVATDEERRYDVALDLHVPLSSDEY